MRLYRCLQMYPQPYVTRGQIIHRRVNPFFLAGSEEIERFSARFLTFFFSFGIIGLVPNCLTSSRLGPRIRFPTTRSFSVHPRPIKMTYFVIIRSSRFPSVPSPILHGLEVQMDQSPFFHPGDSPNLGLRLTAIINRKLSHGPQFFLLDWSIDLRSKPHPTKLQPGMHLELEPESLCTFTYRVRSTGDIINATPTRKGLLPNLFPAVAMYGVHTM